MTCLMTSLLRNRREGRHLRVPKGYLVLGLQFCDVNHRMATATCFIDTTYLLLMNKKGSLSTVVGNDRNALNRYLMIGCFVFVLNITRTRKRKFLNLV